MAVGQFFNPEEGEREFSPWSPPLSGYSHKVNISMTTSDSGILEIIETLSCHLSDILDRA